MIFKELAVKNYGNIKSAKIDLDYKGLTFIFGKNKDGGPNATNGAGKSQLWSAIPEIAYGSPPTGKDGHKHKAAKIRLKFQAGEHEVTFVKDFNAKGNKKFTVLKDGKDVNVRTLDYAQQKLQQYIGKTEEDFYTKVYVDSLRVHPLIMGTAAQRQDFFVRRFNLENVDNIRKLLLRELSDVQKNVATYREVQSMFEETKARLTTTTEEREEICQSIEELTTRRDRLLSKSNELQGIRDLVAFAEQNQALISRFLKTSSVESLSDDQAAAKKSRSLLRDQLALAHEWQAYRKASTKYNEQLKAIKPQLDKLVGPDPDIATIKARADKYADTRAEVKHLRSKLDELKDKIETVQIPEPPKLQDVEKIRRVLGRLRDELDHVHEFKNGKCPTCGAEVDGRDPEVIRAEISKWEKTEKALKVYEKAVAASEEAKLARSEYRQVKDQVEALSSKLAKYKAAHEAEALLDELPSKPERPEPEGEDLEIDDLEVQLEKVSRRLSLFESVQDLVPTLKRYQRLTSDQIKKVKTSDQVGRKLTELNTQLTKLEVQRNQQEEVVKQLKQLRSRGKVLRRSIGDEVILKTLVDAYSTKGLKKFMIQRFAKMLESQVNKFARFTFSEDFTFEFKYEKRLEVLVHRRYGKRIKSTDVKRLSGAEKRMFTLLLVIADYTLTPLNKRSNMLVLDEMEANMGPEAIQNFLKALPVLNKIVPHIVVITPKPDLHVEGARCFTAVKKNGVTTLVSGREGAH